MFPTPHLTNAKLPSQISKAVHWLPVSGWFSWSSSVTGNLSAKYWTTEYGSRSCAIGYIPANTYKTYYYVHWIYSQM